MNKWIGNETGNNIFQFTKTYGQKKAEFRKENCE